MVIVTVMDQAGWHIAGDLVVPENISLVYLQPCSPAARSSIRWST